MKKVLFLLPVVSSLLGACVSHEPQPLYTPQPEFSGSPLSDEDKARFEENIVVKQHGSDFVTYEYRNVRIDELAPLAINYCLDNSDGKKAYLREIVMRENHSKFATFDCVDFQ